MAIDSTARKVVYEGNGSTTTFQFFFKLFEATDVAVQVGESGDTPATLTYGTDFTAVLNADQTTNPGGTVTLATAPATGVNVAVVSAIPETQPMVLTPYDGFNPETLNESADRAVALVQQLSEKLERAITVDATDTMSSAELKNKLLTAADTAYEVAMQYAAQASASATAAANSAQEAADSVSTVVEASEAAAGSASSANDAAKSASTSASSASTSAAGASDSAELAKKWATDTGSPDDESDTESATGKTQSSRSWALSGKAEALAAQTSADSASASAATAQSYADASATSAKTATTGATTATAKASDASASAEAAKNAADEAKQALVDADVSTALRYTAQTLTDAQKAQARTNIGSITGADLSGYLPLKGGTMTGPIVVATAGEAIRSSNDVDGVVLKGGTSYETGASIQLFGSSSSNYAGNFILKTDSKSNRNLIGAPDGSLSWNGSFYATVLQATSDIRKKSDLKELSADLSSIKAYSYILKTDGKRHAGLIAQEVEKVIPEAVSNDPDGFKSLDYNAIVALLVGEVNALKKEIKDLKGE